jgi:hypothetical protein
MPFTGDSRWDTGNNTVTPFQRIGELLADAVQQLHEVSAPGQVVATVKPLPEMFRRATMVAAGRAAVSPFVSAERLIIWQYEVACRVSVMRGEVEVYCAATSAAARRGAGGMILRNAVELARLLWSLPVGAVVARRHRRRPAERM